VLLDLLVKRLDDPYAYVGLTWDVHVVDATDAIIDDAEVASSKVGVAAEPHADVCVQRRYDMWMLYLV